MKTSRHALRLGGVLLDVEPAPCEADAFKARYQAFKEPADAQGIVVRTRFDRASVPLTPPPWPGARCVREGDRLVFSRRDDTLAWDVQARRATFTIARSAPEGPLPTSVPPFVETALRMVVATELIRTGGFIVHAAGYADKRGAVVFAAHSGGGKTTSANKLPVDSVLSDDQVAIVGEDAFSLPFVGQWNRRPVPQRVALRALVLLGKSAAPRLEPLGQTTALARLLGSVVSFDPGQALQTVDHALRLVRRVPTYALDLALDTPLMPWVDRVLDTHGI